jgi:anti-sigma factor RsiW
MTTQACPRGESIAALAEGTLTPPEAGRLADHAAECPSCFRALAAARAVAATPLPSRDFSLSTEDLRSLRSSPDEIPAAPLPRVPARRRIPLWFPYAAAAGVALLVVAGGLQMLDGSPAVPSGEGTVRGSGAGIALLSPASGAVLGAPPERIEWRAEGAGGEFRVRILASVTEEIWRDRTSERAIPLPPEARARLSVGGRFLVEVGRMKGSAEPGEVAVAAFEVRAPR